MITCPIHMHRQGFGYSKKLFDTFGINKKRFIIYHLCYNKSYNTDDI